MKRLSKMWLLGLAFGAMAMTSSLAAQSPTRGPYTGRALVEVLRELQRSGLQIVFSSELVKPDMRVSAEPAAKDPRGRLDDLLRPHGLTTQAGPGGAILVIRRPSTRPAETRPVQPDPPAGTIRGVVVDAETGTPLAGVRLQIQGTAGSAVTDEEGAFALDRLSPGRLTVYVSLVGYALLRPTAEVAPGEITEMRIALTSGTGTYAETVTVRPEGGPTTDAAVPAMRRLGNAEIQQLRGVLADDPVRAVHALPGVTAGDDFRTEFSVRAADFRHIGVSIDGIAVPWPLHAVRGRGDTGSIAIVNSDVLDHISLAPAAYPQRNGSRTAAWLDLGIREGSRTTPRVHGAVGATNASLVAEGPLGGGRGSWIASIRRSYLDWLLRALDFDSGTSFGFFDHQSKLVFDLSARHQLQLTAVAGRSGLDETEIDPGPNSISEGDSHTAVVTAGARSVLGGLVMLQRVSFVSQGFTNTGDFGQRLGDGSFQDVSYRADASLQATARGTLELGAEVRRRQESRSIREYNVSVPSSTDVRSFDGFSGASWLQAGYVHLGWKASDRFQINPGLRVAHSTLTDETLASPWVQASWRAGRSTVRVGAGLYEQFPEFEHVLGAAGNPRVTRERARHLDVAFEHKPTDRLRWQVTLYDRPEQDLLRLENGEPQLVDDAIRPPFATRFENALDGSSRGVELTVERRDTNGLSGWISYAYGEARYQDRLTGESFWADFDQRHTLNVYGQYRLSGRTNVSTKFRIGSNVPLAGYFVERDSGYYLSERRNETRLPSYARLDVRADRTFDFTKKRLTLFVEVLNVFNRKNVGPADGNVRFSTREATGFVEPLFPFLPSAGLLIEF